ncbi:RNA polymerase sigma-70 factor, ECF subfamily [Pseudomonas extremorientalis]|uniref:RNA polymerase sigma-70 factor, ECF subfamily n=1 Tax=Pseudomonas extremorientalis TaxID=169669 RepID=A0ABY0T450_9PSED|nr:RNA polymerase sigma-70 factor, ECF subfamily [Pseudomonas extremorientalis]
MAVASLELPAERRRPGPGHLPAAAGEEPALEIHAPRSFLAKVAQSVLSNHFRRQKLEKAYLQALALLPEDAAPNAETQWILLETLMALDEVLSRLALPVRQAFLWSQLDGLSHGEIAERLGTSITTVKRYIVKAGAQCILLDSQRS